MSKVRLKFRGGAIPQILKSDAALEIVKAHGERTAEACNSASSWGGYFTYAEVGNHRARAVVLAADGRTDEARDQRLLRNLQ